MNKLLKDRFIYNNGQLIRINSNLYTKSMKHEFLYILEVQTGIKFDEKNYKAYKDEYEDKEQDRGTDLCICGHPIFNLCTIVFKDGTTFQVGNECVNKVSPKLRAQIDDKICCKCDSIRDKRGKKSELKLCKSCYDETYFTLFDVVKKLGVKQKTAQIIYKNRMIKKYNDMMIKIKTQRKELLMLKRCKKCNQLNINKFERHINFCHLCEEPQKVLINFIKIHLINVNSKSEEEKRKKHIYDNEFIIFNYKNTYPVKEIIKKHNGIFNFETKKWSVKRKTYLILLDEINIFYSNL